LSIPAGTRGYLWILKKYACTCGYMWILKKVCGYLHGYGYKADIYPTGRVWGSYMHNLYLTCHDIPTPYLIFFLPLLSISIFTHNLSSFLKLNCTKARLNS